MAVSVLGVDAAAEVLLFPGSKYGRLVAALQALLAALPAGDTEALSQALNGGCVWEQNLHAMAVLQHI